MTATATATATATFTAVIDGGDGGETEIVAADLASAIVAARAWCASGRWENGPETAQLTVLQDGDIVYDRQMVVGA